MRTAIVPGATFPDDSLPEHTDTIRSLSELQGHDPMIPHTLVLKPRLVVHSIDNGDWWRRPSLDDLWRDLRAATAETRPDWDLAKPGLREACDAGDWSSFHGWDRRSPHAPVAS